ncbi:MAG: helix-turn-helix domain-containing protein [Oligoflexales bacterium]
METEKDRNDSIGRRLQLALQEADISLTHAASIAGVSTSTLCNWVSGCSPWNFEALDRLCEHLGVSMAYLLTGKQDRFHRVKGSFDGRAKLFWLIPADNHD